MGQQPKQDLQKAQEASEAKKAEEAEKAKIASNGSGDKKEIDQMLDAASKNYGIPPDILKAVAWQRAPGIPTPNPSEIGDSYHFPRPFPLFQFFWLTMGNISSIP